MNKIPIILMAIFCSLVFAESKPFHVPVESALSVVGNGKLPSITFRGEQEISGTYQFNFSKEYVDSPTELYFYPSSTSKNELPYLTYRGDEKAEEIYIKNTGEAANILLGSEMADKFMAGKIKHISGEAIILISDYFAGYECDAPLFMAEIQKQIIEVSVAKNVLSIKHTGC